MSEEEKEAILNLDTLALNGSSLTITEDIQKDIKEALNLIQKQQEEIEKKDKITDEISKNPYNELKVNGILFTGTDIKQYFESKV